MDSVKETTMANQNIQDAFLNNARKDRAPVTIYLTSGVKLIGRVKGFDKYCVVFETHHQEQLLFKHAISAVVSPRHGGDAHRSAERSTGEFPASPAANQPMVDAPSAADE